MAAKTSNAVPVNIPSRCLSPPSSIAGSYIGSVMSASSLAQSLTVDESFMSADMEIKLKRARKLSEAIHSRSSKYISGTPTHPNDITMAWAVPMINLYLVKHDFNPVQIEEVTEFKLNHFKESVGDFSSTHKLDVEIRRKEDGEKINLSFVIKLLPMDDPARVFVFQANLMEKEIEMYFDILPALSQFLSAQGDGSGLKNFVADLIPECVYGTHNAEGSGALVFKSCVEKGFRTCKNPEGLNLQEIFNTTEALATFHAVGRAFILKSTPLFVRRRYESLGQDMYCSELFLEQNRRHFQMFDDLLMAAPEKDTYDARKIYDILRVHGVKRMTKGLRRQGPSSLNTIVHGEVWEKNILMNPTTSECLLLDWKNAKIGSATLDLAFLLFSSASLEVLAVHLTEVCEHYYKTYVQTLEKLQPASSGPTWEEFEEDFRSSSLDTLIQAICMCINEMKFLENILRTGKDKHSAAGSEKYEEETQKLRIYESRAIQLLQVKAVQDLIRDVGDSSCCNAAAAANDDEEDAVVRGEGGFSI